MVRLKSLVAKIKQESLSFLTQEWCKWCGMAILVIALICSLVYLPEWQGEGLPDSTPELQLQKAKQIDDYRATIAQILGGFALIIGIYLTWRRIAAVERTVELTEEGQITDRFTRAIEHLGDENLTVRLGGIYALERIAKDSRKDHWTVIEILLAFVRENDYWEPSYNDEGIFKSQEFDWEIYAATKPLPTDINAILSVLSRRKWINFEQAPLCFSNTVLKKGSLAGAYLAEADFSEANLAGVDFSNADLSGAKFDRAYLANANFGGAILKDVSFSEANIEYAVFWGADIRGVSFLETCCSGALFVKANLKNTDFTEAIMKNVIIKDSCLDGINFERTDLSGARIKGVDLSKLCLRYAILNGVDFNGVNLSGTDLVKAHLEGADLSNSIGLTKEQIAQAHIDEKTILPSGFS